jgi:hypothetical protein
MSTTEVILSGAYQYEKSGDIFSVYSFFNTYNFTNQEASSSYALPFTPLVFKPRINDTENFLSRKRILWDFGDGTNSEAITAKHTYKLPGRYKVTCYLYDKLGNSYYDSFAQNVDIYNFVPDSISINFSTSASILTAGRISNPIAIYRSTSFQSYTNGRPNLSIVPFASGSIEGTNFFDTNIVSKYYSHLYPYSSFYLKLTGSRGLTEFLEVSSFETSSIPIYCRLVDNSVQVCSRSDQGSFFCGTTGMSDVFFKSDIPCDNLNLFFGLQPGALREFCNTTTVGVSARVIENTDLDRLSISSNGLDGEGETSLLFPINKNKFSNTEISFVVKVKDSSNFTIKNLPAIDDIDFVLTDGTIIYPAVFKSDLDALPTQAQNGVYVGTVTLDTNTTCENVFISAGTTINSKRLIGTSNTFNIYTDGVYNIAKKGEDIDMVQAFKDISFQPLFLNNPTLYDAFLYNIFGSVSSSQTSIGKVTHEKIENFVSNTASFEYANVDRLVSLFKEYDITDSRFDSVNYRYPAAIARLVDILTIKQSKLFGARNNFNEDFKTFGYYDSQIYGTNIGKEITLQQTITAGNNSIITFERFSGNFRLVNSFQPVSAASVNSKTYQIVNYQDDWGWGLVLPEDGYGAEISNYYFFYEHIPTIEGSVVNSVINFDDPNTTLTFANSSYSDWSEKDGVISAMLANQLYKGLDLIK